jgi:hypothetical protein
MHAVCASVTADAVRDAPPLPQSAAEDISNPPPPPPQP